MVGVEPVVAIAHRMESFLRDFDRSGGMLPMKAIDALLKGVRAIEQRVAAMGRGEAVLPPSDELLADLDSLGLAQASASDTPPPVLTLDAELLANSRLSKSIAVRGIAAGARAAG